MPPRTLTTIGDLTMGQPLTRTRNRRMAMNPGRSTRVTLGSATADTGGDALQTASLDLLNKFDSSGVTPESVGDPVVLAFQKQWNADPLNQGDQLVQDAKYGPLTKGALDAMVGGIAPPVNGGIAPAPAPPAPAPHVTPGPAPLVKPAAGGTSHLALFLLIAAAAIGGYLLLRKKRRGGGGHRRSAPIVEVRSNPRRRRRNSSALIP
jgi:LPXTG-motif cell wall-anchored protein